QSVDSVRYVEGDPSRGALISISNNDKLVMPVVMKITRENGSSEIIELPVQVWHRGDSWTTHFPSDSKIQRVEIDPRKEFPDVNPANNVWQSGEDAK
ncbi:MAG TPA: hypothetical protein VK074_08610, partial [Fodinibius sp.]|nr:hypothetical protein [Fodinibius sp.]